MKNNNGVKLERSYEKHIKVFGKSLKVLRVILIAVVGIVYTVMLANENGSYIPMAFAIFFIALLVFAIYLRQKSFIYFGEYCLEASEAGDIYLTMLHGHCPKCEGHLKLVKKRKGLGKFVTYILCDKNSTHIWNAFSNSKDDKNKKKNESKS
ncbi:MAG: hypothetical protein HRT42_02585 [Campylobacteraceae bacterium]|nr:hypothetical protein [Campylobacteraceae bacterium]